jgi:hypothetical protein
MKTATKPAHSSKATRKFAPNNKIGGVNPAQAILITAKIGSTALQMKKPGPNSFIKLFYAHSV